MPEIPEHLLRRSAQARAEALGVPLEQALAEMGLTPEGEAVSEPLEEMTADVSAATPETEIPEELQAREAAARQTALGESAAQPAPVEELVEAEETIEPAPAEEPVTEAPAAAAESKVPEALLRRSAEAKAKATGRQVEEILAEMAGGGAPAGGGPAAEPKPTEPEPVAAPAASGSKLPEALLRRSAEAKAKATGRPVEEILAEMAGGGAPAGEPKPAEEPAEEPPAPASETPGAPPEPEVAGRTTIVTAPPVTPPAGTPEGVRPQRLLTVVRAKSIQQVKAEPTDKVNVWPHLLLIEFVALLGVTAFLIVLSVILQAPLLELANFNATPNPSKAPWYFLGLQELLSYFDPQIAGVTVPGIIGLIGLMAVPYVDRNPSTKPSDRKFAIVFFTFFLVAAATLTMLGTLFRGPGFNFSYPWSDGIWFDDLKDWISFE
jgi:hypothetical protein